MKQAMLIIFILLIQMTPAICAEPNEPNCIVQVCYPYMLDPNIRSNPLGVRAFAELAQHNWLDVNDLQNLHKCWLVDCPSCPEGNGCFLWQKPPELAFCEFSGMAKCPHVQGDLEIPNGRLVLTQDSNDGCCWKNIDGDVRCQIWDNGITLSTTHEGNFIMLFAASFSLEAGQQKIIVQNQNTCGFPAYVAAYGGNSTITFCLP